MLWESDSRGIKKFVESVVVFIMAVAILIAFAFVFICYLVHILLDGVKRYVRNKGKQCKRILRTMVSDS